MCKLDLPDPCIDDEKYCHIYNHTQKKPITGAKYRQYVDNTGSMQYTHAISITNSVFQFPLGASQMVSILPVYI